MSRKRGDWIWPSFTVSAVDFAAIQYCKGDEEIEKLIGFLGAQRVLMVREGVSEGKH